ncbi:ABC transporter ATP-binding protein [Streptacidiphilus carbonis]|uniref:ABC transporter ATP-binding protein n=1 Tax=Streptacidiphilus carbonis TaxID=105422 RepID=UPI0005A643B0|nr:ATP-binding cassette domain-containing protein [Streptacidiphilus carbonis]
MRLHRIAVRYGRRDPWVLRDVSLELHQGQLLRATGGNGGGKSTLLRVVVGACEPNRGAVHERPARRAYVPERFPAALPFTSHDYLCHLGRVHGLHGAEPARRATAMLERLGAAAFAGTPLAELSKGTCQKVAVAQALVGDPELLVLDEAWTGLDQDARAVLDQAVAERLEQGCTVLFVDHDPTRLAALPALRWHVGDGTVRADEAGSGTAAVVITLTGRLGGAKGLAELPGVGAVGEPAPDTVRVTVGIRYSDDVLRTLLADSTVHVEQVEAVR